MLQSICFMIFSITLFVAFFAIIGMQYEGRRQASKLKWTAGADIDTWARDNGLEVKVSQKKTNYFNGRVGGYAGPFIGKVYAGQHVYRVVVTKVGEEKRRVAWIRVGESVWGNTPEPFKMIWEDEWRPPEPPAS